jgi:hypothetical protein
VETVAVQTVSVLLFILSVHAIKYLGPYHSWGCDYITANNIYLLLSTFSVRMGRTKTSNKSL